VTKGEKQSFRHFDNQKQLELSEDPNYRLQHLSGDQSTDNRMTVTEPEANTMAMAAMQAQSGMFMHPMHDVTATDQVHGDQVLEQLQAELDQLEASMEYGTNGQTDPNEKR
jgi:hypothetical protein